MNQFLHVEASCPEHILEDKLGLSLEGKFSHWLEESLYEYVYLSWINICKRPRVKVAFDFFSDSNIGVVIYTRNIIIDGGL